MDNLKSMLERHEGRRYDWYQDTNGNWTNGIGHKATIHDDTSQSWTDEIIDANYDCDVKHAIAPLAINIAIWEQLDSVRQSALIDMCFNMGWGKLRLFVHMLAAVERQDWNAAAHEALDSAWSTEVGHRATEISEMLRTGNWQA